MVWFGFGYRGFGQLGDGEHPSLELPDPAEIPGPRVGSKDIIKAAPCWSYTAYLAGDGSLLLSGFIKGEPWQYLCFPDLGCLDVLPSEKYMVALFKERVECWETMSLGPEGDRPEAMWKMDLPGGLSKAFPLVANGYVLPQPPFFRELPPKVEALKLSLGNEHAVLLTSDRTVLTWGAGRLSLFDGELNVIAISLTPYIGNVFESFTIKNPPSPPSAGVSSDVAVICDGGTRHGQLGHGDLEDVFEPRIVDALHGLHMSEVAAGGWHSACISDGGDIYCWGWNESGQLGLPSKTLAQERGDTEDTENGDEGDEVSEFITIQSFPALIDLPQESEALKISCGSRHTACVTRSGELYTWGWGRYGQLGRKDKKTADHPIRVEYFSLNQIYVKDVRTHCIINTLHQIFYTATSMGHQKGCDGLPGTPTVCVCTSVSDIASQTERTPSAVAVPQESGDTDFEALRMRTTFNEKEHAFLSEKRQTPPG